MKQYTPADQTMIRQAQDNDPRAREEVVRHYAPLVRSIASKYLASGEPIEDLIQEGNLGLISALGAYDAGRGSQFVTFAYRRITGHILHYIRDRSGLIPIPAWVQERMARLQRSEAQLADRLGREPTVVEVMADTGASEEQILELRRLRQLRLLRSIDAPVVDSEGDVVSLERYQPLIGPTNDLSVEDRAILMEALSHLQPGEREILHEVYFKDVTQTELAQHLGVSNNFVSRTLKSSMRKLQEILGDAPPLPSRFVASMEESEADALTDAATGLYREWYLRERLAEEIIRAHRYAYPVALMHVAIGAADDVALQELAGLCRATVRRVDLLARTGEATITVLMPHTGEAGSVVFDRLAASLRACSKPPVAALALEARFAHYPQDGRTADEIWNAGRRLTPPG